MGIPRLVKSKGKIELEERIAKSNDEIKILENKITISKKIVFVILFSHAILLILLLRSCKRIF